MTLDGERLRDLFNEAGRDHRDRCALTMAWYFDDETTTETDELLDCVARDGAVVPGLWRLEVANAFETAIRRRHIDGSYPDASLTEFGFLPITTAADTNRYARSAILRLAECFSLGTCDAADLELAHRRGLPLATLDQDLRKAAPRFDIELLGTRERQPC